jgi:ornithine decarboxylase
MPGSSHSITAASALPVTRYASVQEVIETLQPDLPVYALHPQEFQRVADAFRQGFPGETMYAVKANHALPVLDMVHGAGIRRFDVASIAEVRYIAERSPEAMMNFMAPVRIRGTTGEAYRLYGVRHFALDSQEELHAALEETGASHDRSIAASLTLYVRLQVPADGALLELSSKFGVSVSGAAALLREIGACGARPALTFHVGSQCLFPSSYRTALARCGEVIQLSGTPISALDVGGGFPGYYQNVTVPPLDEYFSVIRDGLKDLSLPGDCTILCEPGRALVADGMSVITQVSLRRGQTLYINDGIYGSLNEYALKNWPVRYPARVYTTAPNGRIREKKSRPAAFKVYGPTCDSLDVLNYLIDLPDQIAAGDWIEFQKTGAYSCALRTAFNGFYPDAFVAISRDETPRFTAH